MRREPDIVFRADRRDGAGRKRLAGEEFEVVALQQGDRDDFDLELAELHADAGEGAASERDVGAGFDVAVLVALGGALEQLAQFWGTAATCSHFSTIVWPFFWKVTEKVASSRPRSSRAGP